MSEITSYRGRVVTDADVEFICQLIAAHPDCSRRALSQMVCEAWNWRQPNGQVRDVVCRGLLLVLHRAGRIELPSPRWRPTKPARRTVLTTVDIDQTPIDGDLHSLRPLRFEHVRRTACEPLFNYLIEQHHYLGYTRPVGEHLKYLVYSRDRMVAALAWSSAAHGLSCRDRFIGWSAAARQMNRHLLAYNSRFLVPPWVRVPHLASHVLGRMVRQLSADWERMYQHPLYFVETFVEPARHRGSCYRAANWIVLGQTSGRGHRCPTKQPTRPVKLVLGYPLVKHFRELLGGCGSRCTEEPRHEDYSRTDAVRS
jgi:Druantia protein DruA